MQIQGIHVRWKVGCARTGMFFLASGKCKQIIATWGRARSCPNVARHRASGPLCIQYAIDKTLTPADPQDTVTLSAICPEQPKPARHRWSGGDPGCAGCGGPGLVWSPLVTIGRPDGCPSKNTFGDGLWPRNKHATHEQQLWRTYCE